MERTSPTFPSAVLEIPAWLSAPQATIPGTTETLPALTAREMVQYTHDQYAAFFETLLERVASGMTLTDVLSEDGRYETFRYSHWIHKNEERKARFYEAKAIGAEMIEDQMLGIADAINDNGTMSMEDVQRSTLRINTRWKLLAVWNKQRYGSSHQIEVKNTNPLTENSLEALAGRLQSLRRQSAGEVVDVTARESE